MQVVFIACVEDPMGMVQLSDGKNELDAEGQREEETSGVGGGALWTRWDASEVLVEGWRMREARRTVERTRVRMANACGHALSGQAGCECGVLAGWAGWLAGWLGGWVGGWTEDACTKRRCVAMQQALSFVRGPWVWYWTRSEFLRRRALSCFALDLCAALVLAALARRGGPSAQGRRARG